MTRGDDIECVGKVEFKWNVKKQMLRENGIMN